MGNSITRGVFRAVSGVKVRDTQTGLRAMGMELLPELLELKGERYEYEMNMLLYAARQRIKITEVDIETVYLEDNASSHFDTLRDSAKIYAVIFKFVASSLVSFGIDFAALLLLQLAVKDLMAPETALTVSVVGARLISSFCNYLMNRRFVFGHKGKKSILRYYVVAALILGLNIGFMQLLGTLAGLATWLAKVITELILYPTSYVLQRRYVFVNK